MNRNARVGAALLGGVAVLVAAWAGGSIYAGRVAAGELRGLAARDASASSLSIAVARHDTGLFSSAGSFEVRFDEHCSAPGETGRAALKVDYRVSHLLQPGSMMRFD